jgi:hypothetical protein
MGQRESRQTCVDVPCAYLRMPYGADPEDQADTEAQLAYRALREVRHTVVRVITEHLKDGAAVSWQGLNFDFTGVVFDGGDFTGARFSGGQINFNEARFSVGQVNFGGSRPVACPDRARSCRAAEKACGASAGRGEGPTTSMRPRILGQPSIPWQNRFVPAGGVVSDALARCAATVGGSASAAGFLPAVAAAARPSAYSFRQAAVVA